MSEPASSGSSSGGGEVVRGEGHSPLDKSTGEAMPSVTTTERKSLSDFKRHLAEKNDAPARAAAAPPPQTAKSRVASFSDRLERMQQAPVNPNEPRGQQPPAERDEREPPEQQQIADPDPNADPEQQPTEESGETPPEQAAASPDDRAALEKYRQWEQDEMFPAELEGKLHEVKPNGITRYVDTRELRQGYMRGGDYRKAYNELQGREKQITLERQAQQQHFEAIRDPGQMLEIYERNGYGPTLEKVAEILHARRQERQQIIEGAGIAAMRALGLRTADWNHKDVQAAMVQAEQRLTRAHEAEIERRQLNFEKSRFQQTQQQTQSDQKRSEYAALYERQTNQLRPNAFRAYGLADTPGNRQALKRHLGNVIAAQGFNGEITRALVMAAASDLKDELDDARGSERALDAQNGRRPGVGQPLPPNRIAAGGGAPLGNLAGKQRGSLSDLEAMVRKGRMQ